MTGIRIRDAKGRILPLPAEAAVVELCSSDGKVARLLFGGGNRVTILDPSDPEFRSYCKSLKLEMAEVIRLVD
jgi:hypothetical protein